MHAGNMRWLIVITLLPALALAEQDVYLDPVLRGIEVYLPRGVYPQTPFISAYEVELIRAEVSSVDNDVHDRFRPRFDGWKATWASGVPSTENLEFDLLARMGRPILPLVVEQLLEPENAPALALYDRAAPLEWYVGNAPDDTSPAPVLLRVRALRTVRRWLELSRKETYRRQD